MNFDFDHSLVFTNNDFELLGKKDFNLWSEDDNMTLYLFFCFNKLDGYLNADIGADSRIMYNLFKKFNHELGYYFTDYEHLFFQNFQRALLHMSLQEYNLIDEINPLTIFRLPNMQINFNHLNININIYDLVKEKHSMKLLIYYDDNYYNFIIVNTGFGKGNKNFEWYKCPYYNINEILEGINKRHIIDMNMKIERFKIPYTDYPEDYRIFSDTYCKPQLSGSCTFYSTLNAMYLYLYIILREYSYIEEYKKCLDIFCEGFIKYFINCEKKEEKFTIIKNDKIIYENFCFIQMLTLISYLLNMDEDISDMLKKKIDNINKPLKKQIRVIKKINEIKFSIFENLTSPNNFYHDVDNNYRDYRDYLKNNYDNDKSEKKKYNIFEILFFIKSMIVKDYFTEIYVFLLKMIKDDMINLILNYEFLYKFYIECINILDINNIKNRGFYGLLFLLICSVWEKNNYDFIITDTDTDTDTDTNHKSNLNYVNMNMLYFTDISMYKKASEYFFKYKNCLDINYLFDIIKIRIIDTEYKMPNNYFILHSRLFNINYKSLPFFVDTQIDPNEIYTNNNYDIYLCTKSFYMEKLIFIKDNYYIYDSSQKINNNNLQKIPAHINEYIHLPYHQFEGVSLGNNNYATNEEKIFTYINPFDLNIMDYNDVVFLIETPLNLLIPHNIKNNDECKYIHNYVPGEIYVNDFYNNSEKIFKIMFSSINIQNTYKQKKNIKTMIYIYSIFYELYKNSEYDIKVKHLKDSLETSEIVNKYPYIHESENNTLIKSFIDLLNEQVYQHISFLDIILLGYMMDNIFDIFINGEIQNKIKIKNITLSQNGGYYYKYNNNIYYSTNEIIKSPDFFEDFYNKFNKRDDKNDNYIYYFSDILPNIKENKFGEKILFENDQYFYFHITDILKQKLEDKNITFYNTVCFKNRISSNFKIYCDYILYSNFNKIYFTIYENDAYILSENNVDYKIIDHLHIINNIFYEYGINFFISNKKIYLFINDIISNIDKIKKMTHIYGNPIQSYEDEKDFYGLIFIDLMNQLKNKIKNNKTLNYVFEYDIKMNDKMDQIIDIYMNDNVSTYILLLILSKSHLYNITMKFLNKFLSILNPHSVCKIINHPYSDVISKTFNDNWNYSDINDITDYWESDDTNKKNIYNPLVYEKIKNDKFMDKFYVDLLINKNITFNDYLTQTNQIYRENQKECINSIINSINKKKSIIYEMMMGFGKSKIIIPNIIFEFIFIKEENNLLIIVLPNHLVNSMYNTLLSIFINFPLIIIKKMNHSNLNFNIQNGVAIISDIEIKHALLKNPNSIINSNHNNSRIMIIDEIDDCINPLKSSFNLKKTEELLYKQLEKYDFDKFISIIMDYCSEFNKGKTFIDISKEKIKDIDIFIDCINDRTKCEGNITDYKNKIIAYILKKIYNIIKLINNGNFIYNKDYGLGDNIGLNSYYLAVPYKGINMPENESEFNDVYLTLFLTIYIYIKYDLRDIDYGLIKDYIINSNSKDITFDQDITNISITEFKNLIETEGKIENIKKLYVRNIIVYKIKYIDSYYNTSFLEILNNNISDIRIALTGTPEYIGKLPSPDSEILNFPRIKQSYIFDNMINTEFSTKNNNMDIAKKNFFDSLTIMEDTDHIKEIYNHLKKSFSNKKIKCLIDAGAFFRHKTTRNYAIELKNLGYEEVYYFQKNDNLYRLNTNINNDINDILIKENENIPDGNFLIFYDNVHTRGTDIKLPDNVHGLVTVSPINDIVNIGQAIYRLRKLNIGQTCEFIIDNNTNNEKKDSDLYSYLLKKKDEYIEKLKQELILQTIYANSKFDEIGMYEIMEYQNFILPSEDNIIDTDIKILINNNYELKSKKNKFCSKDYIINHYCTLLDTNINQMTTDISSSISESISQSIATSISHMEKNNFKYEDKKPYSTSPNSFLNIYNYYNSMHPYISYYTHIFLNLEEKNINILISHFLNSESQPIHYLNQINQKGGNKYRKIHRNKK
jgi:hypothetical protein